MIRGRVEEWFQIICVKHLDRYLCSSSVVIGTFGSLDGESVNVSYLSVQHSWVTASGFDSQKAEISYGYLLGFEKAIVITIDNLVLNLPEGIRQYDAHSDRALRIGPGGRVLINAGIIQMMSEPQQRVVFNQAPLTSG